MGDVAAHRRVADLLQEQGLAEEALQVGRGGVAQHLEGHRLPGVQVVGAPDGAHPSAADHRL